jgi:thioredoxin reductase (NADPH)
LILHFFVFKGPPDLFSTQAAENLAILSADALRTLIAKDAELSNIFMRALLLRRVALIPEGLGNVIVLGSWCRKGGAQVAEIWLRI